MNVATTGDQRLADVAVDGAGDFVIVWKNACTNCFEADFFVGSARVSRSSRQGTFASQTLDGVAAAGKGANEFVIAFATNSISGAQIPTHVVQVIGQFGGDATVSTSPTIAKGAVDTAADRDGNFVVVWESLGQDGSGSGIYARRFQADFTPREPSEFRVNTTTSGEQTLPAVAMAPDGGYLVAWQSHPRNGCCAQAFAQRYDAAGAPVGGEFRVSTNSGIGNYYPDVASDASGGFVVSWNAYATVGGVPTFDVLANRFSSSGAAAGEPFRVNTTTSTIAVRAKVSPAPGGFVVVWDELSSDGSAYGILARQYASDGVAVTDPFRVNTFTTGNQFGPAVAVSSGRYVVAWQSVPSEITSVAQDGSGLGVFAQKYCRAGDANGDGEVDVRDALALINALFAGARLPSPCGGDANGSAAVDVADVLYLINHLFAGGPAPVA